MSSEPVTKENPSSSRDLGLSEPELMQHLMSSAPESQHYLAAFHLLMSSVEREKERTLALDCELGAKQPDYELGGRGTSTSINIIY